MRGVTRLMKRLRAMGEFQPALPMRGVTRTETGHDKAESISTRTPHAGSDDIKPCFVEREHVFQPALPMRGVTAILCAKFTASINI